MILFTRFMIFEMVRNYLRGLAALIAKFSVIWDVTPCILVVNYRCLLGRSHVGLYLRYDCRRMTTEYGSQKLEAIYSDGVHYFSLTIFKIVTETILQYP